MIFFDIIILLTALPLHPYDIKVHRAVFPAKNTLPLIYYPGPSFEQRCLVQVCIIFKSCTCGRVCFQETRCLKKIAVYFAEKK